MLDEVNENFEDVGLLRDGIDKFLKQNGGHLALPVSIMFLTDTGIKINKPTQNGLELAKDFDKNPTPIRAMGTAQGLEGAVDREQISLHALQMLSTYESRKPGRKLILCMGAGWPLLDSAKLSVRTGKDARRYYGTITDTTTLLRRAHGTLYSVAPLNLSENRGLIAFVYESFLQGVTRPEEADAPNLGVQVLAVHSGGMVLNKSGDLPSQIRACLADARYYYEVTFDGTPGSGPGVYHSIDVAVDRPGATARTNSAYYSGQAQFTGVAK